MTTQSQSMEDASPPGVPTRTLLLSILALAVPVLAAIWFPAGMETYEALLWLLALVPAFLLAFERGWQGAATALALGMAVLSVTYAVTRLTDGQIPEILFPVVVAYIAITLGLGWFGGELRGAREAARGPGQLFDEETQLPTWAYAARYLEGEFDAARRGRPLAVVLFDLGSKERSERRRDLSGAAATVGEVLGRNTRKLNISARQPAPDDNRFLSVLTGGDLQGAAVFARRVLSGSRGTVPAHHVLSAGVAAYRPGMESVDALLDAAEEALDDARRAGGDRVRVAGTVVRAEPDADGFSEEEPPVELHTTPASRTYRALVVGEAEGLTTIADALETRGIETERRAVVASAMEVLHHPLDLVVIDLDSTEGGQQLVPATQRKQSLTQTLVVVDQGSITAGLDAMNAGAARCLIRPIDPRALDTAVTELLERRDLLLRTKLERTHIADELTARQREVQRILDATEERHRAVLERIQEVVFEIDADGRWQFLTPAWERLTGASVPSSLGMPFSHAFHAEDQETLEAEFRALVAGSTERLDMQVRLGTEGDRMRWVALTGTPSLHSDGDLAAVYGTLVDVTERRRLEEQLRQAQKMEAIGQLAGGIAHDFNNLLLAIRGHAEFALEEADPGSAITDDLRIIVDETERASGLTRQLLAFSREHVPNLEVLDLGDVVQGMKGMLARLLGENIEVIIEAPDAPLHVEADPAQVQQVVMNLATNARDAMITGGRLVVRLEGIEVDRDQARRWGATLDPGPFVLLSVRDTGVGMDDQTARKVFDPFFTTKTVGKGTGLGLSTVLGIVVERRGHVEMETRRGEGTELRIFLPRAGRGRAAAEDREEQEGLGAGAGRTILVVEDEPAVRSVVRRYLEGSGYRVYEAASAAEALQRIAECGLEHLDLVMTDVIMPGLSGIELVERLRERRPDLPVVFMSGYAEEEMLERGHRLEGSFLYKPFDHGDLMTVVARIL